MEQQLMNAMRNDRLFQNMLADRNGFTTEELASEELQLAIWLEMQDALEDEAAMLFEELG